MYMLDTNTLIYFFKGMGAVSEHLFAVSPQDIAVPAVVLYELELGIAKTGSQKRRAQLDMLLHSVNLLPFGEAEAKTSAQLRAYLEAQGMPIGAMDTLIAGTALSHQGILVTRNTKEFSRVPDLEIINWYI